MLHDLKLACRRLRNGPGFTAAAVATLALAVGANTAIFSIADAVLFRQLPYADPERVFVVTTVNRDTGARSWAVPYVYLQAIDENHSGISRVGLRGPTTMTIHAGRDEAEWMETFAVAPDYFQVLGVPAVRGRLFEAGDAAEPGRSAVLTYEGWQRRFAGDPAIVGRSVRLGTANRDVIGVLPRGFLFPATSLRFMYSPTGRPDYVTTAALPVPGADPKTRNPILMGGSAADPIVRLEPAVTREQAQAEIDALIAPLKAGRQEDANTIVLLESPRAILFPTGRPVMGLLVAAAALVLFIGCANLANMLLVRTRRREREIGLHAALGATRVRIVRPIFFETLIIATAAAVLGLIVTALTFDVLLRQVPPIAYGSAAVHIDFRVVTFALALGLGGGFGFAIVPAWSSATLDVQALVQGRRAGGRRRHGVFARPMIAAQVALAIVLVFGAVIAARAFVSVLRVPLGFVPEGLIAINVRPQGQNAPPLRAFYTRAVETLARRADVLSAAAGGSVPMDGFAGAEVVETSGNQRSADVLHVLPGYFETIGMSLISGRLLSWDDVQSGAGVAVLSESATRALFPGRDPVGATLRSRQGRSFTVVGIVADVQRSLSRKLDPPAYVIPLADTTRGMTLVARVRSRGPHTLAQIRREIGALAPDTPVTAVWWSDSIDALTDYRNPRFQTLVLGSFAALALGLTALGIFAVVAFVVAARTREMGVRLALGAQPHSLVMLVVRQALAPVAAGLLAGLVAAQWLRRLAEAQLFEVNARDPATLAAAAITVTAAALVAAYVPARHASRVDPIVVLRAE